MPLFFHRRFMKKIEDLAYFAGLVDGEGTICIMKHGVKNGRIRLEICLSICNTNKAIITDIRTFFSSGTVIVDKRTVRKKPLWDWEIRGIKAKEIIKSLYPFLRIKKSHAKSALDFPLAKSGALGMNGYSKSDTEKRHEVYRILRELNRR